jgi:hypothetical protein
VLTVLCWLWPQPGGRTQFNAGHVNTWARMVRRNLSMPHRLACVTNIPEDIDSSISIIAPPDDFDDVRIPTWGPKRPQCLRRLTMFRPDAAAIFGDRFACMDLDCVIGGSLDPLFGRPEEFVMCRGTAAKRPYNGSLLMMTAGARPQVYTQFSQTKAIIAGAKFVGSDQAWIAYILGGNEARWSEADGVAFYGANNDQKHPDCRVMFFPGSMKPWHVDGAHPQGRWISRHYRQEAREAA